MSISRLIGEASHISYALGHLLLCEIFIRAIPTHRAEHQGLEGMQLADNAGQFRRLKVGGIDRDIPPASCPASALCNECGDVRAE